MSRSWSMHPVTQLTLARIREFIREPEAVFWSYVFPLVMIVSLGLAFRSEPVEAVAVVVQDGERSGELVKVLKASPKLVVTSGSADECRRQLRSGKSELIIVEELKNVSGTLEASQELRGELLPESSRHLFQHAYRFVFDPTRPGSVHARDAVNDVLQRAAGRIDPVPSHDDAMTDPGSRYIDFLVPGLIGMGLMGGGIWGVGFGIVDMRIRQLLKRFLGTPMKKPHFIAAIMISRIVFMIPEILIVLVASRLLFDVVNHGSYLIMTLLIVLGAFEFAGIGLLVASRAKTLEAVSGLMNLSMVPMWIASGIFFSPDRFPSFAQPLINLLPLTPLIGAMRRVMQEGAELTQLIPELAIIIGWGVVTFLLGLRLFRWE